MTTEFVVLKHSAPSVLHKYGHHIGAIRSEQPAIASALVESGQLALTLMQQALLAAPASLPALLSDLAAHLRATARSADATLCCYLRPHTRIRGDYPGFPRTVSRKTLPIHCGAPHWTSSDNGITCSCVRWKYTDPVVVLSVSRWRSPQRARTHPQGWHLENRDTWIGATDAAAFLRFLGFDAVLVDFSSPKALAARRQAKAVLEAAAGKGPAALQQAQLSLHQLWSDAGGAAPPLCKTDVSMPAEFRRWSACTFPPNALLVVLVSALWSTLLCSMSCHAP